MKIINNVDKNKIIEDCKNIIFCDIDLDNIDCYNQIINNKIHQYQNIDGGNIYILTTNY